jgi:hypothetical protein
MPEAAVELSGLLRKKAELPLASFFDLSQYA